MNTVYTAVVVGKCTATVCEREYADTFFTLKEAKDFINKTIPTVKEGIAYVRLETCRLMPSGLALDSKLLDYFYHWPEK